MIAQYARLQSIDMPDFSGDVAYPMRAFGAFSDTSSTDGKLPLATGLGFRVHGYILQSSWYCFLFHLMCSIFSPPLTP